MRICWAQYAFMVIVAVLGLAAMLAGCGAKGDLYLPPEQDETVQAAPVTETTANDDKPRQ